VASSILVFEMKTVPQKIKSFFILCIAALPLIFAAYVQISEAVIHHEMKEQLEQKNLVTVHVKSFQLVWTDKGKEARINGNMFDVESYKINGNDIELTGLFDKNEDALFAQIDNARQKNNPDATGSVLVLKWFGCFVWNTQQTITGNLSPQKIITVSNQQNNILQNPFLSCITPPPKFFSI